MMAGVRDILLDDNFDLKVENGDFAVRPSDGQHLALIALLEPGQLRHSPLTGLGMYRRLQSPMGAEPTDGLRKDLYEQMEFDGYRPGTTDITFDGEIVIRAER